MTIHDELFKIADLLDKKSGLLNEKDFITPLERLEDSAKTVGKAWSGSWLGFHSKIYYSDFVKPPPGAHFSQEWGLGGDYTVQGTVGDWREYRFDDVIEEIKKNAENPNIHEQEARSSEIKEFFEESHSQVLSLISVVLNNRKNDKFLQGLSANIEDMKIYSETDLINKLRPSSQIITRDRVALQQGLQAPPHITILVKVFAIKYPFIACRDLSKLSHQVASHIQNIEKRRMQAEQVGTNVFIGHSRSSAWKDLKDFIKDRMQLPWDEFNRVPAAGTTNIERLSEMLDDAAIAFLIMTAEDEQPDGKQHARQNVIHEAGLFQGRLGFKRAIILLEEGCQEFSNIHGLVQIRFPKGNISAVYEEIRKVLEREGLVDKK